MPGRFALSTTRSTARNEIWWNALLTDTETGKVWSFGTDGRGGHRWMYPMRGQ